MKNGPVSPLGLREGDRPVVVVAIPDDAMSLRLRVHQDYLGRHGCREACFGQ